MIGEAWQFLASLPPFHVALVMFGLGLVFGSFGYATHLRLVAGENPVGPRSHCPSCEHKLAALELIPLLSYLWLRGRCRKCLAPIPIAYPLAELTLGLAAAAFGYARGWNGGAGAIALGLTLAAGAGVWRRRHSIPRGSPGMTLVENLVAVSLIALVSAPVLNLVVHSVESVRAAEQRMAMYGVARQRLNELESIGRLKGYGPLNAEVQNNAAVEIDDWTATVSEWAPDTNTKVHRVVVTVKRTCTTGCEGRFGALPLEVKLTSYLWAK